MAALRVLQKSLEEAQKNLSVTDDAIRKVTGRDPNESRLVVDDYYDNLEMHVIYKLDRPGYPPAPLE